MKQRIVGALVLLALGVLFIPMLFEPDSRRTLDQTTQIPPAPDIEPMVVTDPVRDPNIAPVRSAERQYQVLEDMPASRPAETPRTVAVTPPATAPRPAASATPVASAPAQKAPAVPLVVREPEPDRQVLGENGMPAAWMVQVASFGTEDRANALRDQLLGEGYPAFTRTFDASGSKMTRVFVGPKLSRDKALEMKASLDKSLKINTLVVSFSP